MTRFLLHPVLAVVLVALSAHPARGQLVPVPIDVGQPAGVYIDADGVLRTRQSGNEEMAAQRLRARALNAPSKAQDLTCVSLPRLVEQVKSLTEASKPLPDDVRFLSGLTQIRYVFVYPQEHDLLIAGPSEPYDASGKSEPHGKVTGRPVLHLDDLVMALRSPRTFGCSLDPHPDSLNRCNAVMKEYASATLAARMNALKDAMGPQQVRMFGAPGGSRMAFVTVAADYKLKRLILGLDAMPVPGVGSPVDNTRAAGNRFWFEADYAPLLVSADDDAFELRGPRLVLKAGAFSFDTKGATETSKAFARRFSDKFPQLATVVPLFADLQNLADLSVVANLIRKDRLDQKAGVDLSWLTAGDHYKPAPIPTPTTAETLVNYTNGSLVAGGVTLNAASVVAAERERDAKGTLKPVMFRPPAGADRWFATRSAGETASPKH